MGFKERQRDKVKQRVLEASQQWIADGNYPRPHDIAYLVRTSPQTVEKYQQKLIQEGLLLIPEGLSGPFPAKRPMVKKPKSRLTPLQSGQPITQIAEDEIEIPPPAIPVDSMTAVERAHRIKTLQELYGRHKRYLK